MLPQEYQSSPWEDSYALSDAWSSAPTMATEPMNKPSSKKALHRTFVVITGLLTMASVVLLVTALMTPSGITHSSVSRHHGRHEPEPAVHSWVRSSRLRFSASILKHSCCSLGTFHLLLGNKQ